MANLAVINLKRQEVGKVDLPDAVFAYPDKRHLMFEAVRHFRACARAGTHKAKNRSEISGGGKKPWKQKGTGRARVGSTRSPLWRHGGTIFGPVPRDYSYDFPKKARRRALASALSAKLREARLTVIDALALAQPKTKQLQGLVRQELGLTGKVLVVFDGEQPNFDRAARNHPQICALRSLQVHAYHVLNSDHVVLSRAAAEQLGEVLGR
ncbi:MAG: 50S ribosomal protein L4 [Acidobacteriota bacterium]